MQLILTAIFSAAAIILNIVRYFTAMEPSGLFIKGHPLTYILTALLIVFFVICLVLNMSGKKTLRLEVSERQTPCTFAKIMSFVMIGASVLLAASYASGFLSAGTPVAQDMISIVFALAMAFSFLPVAVFFATGEAKPSTAGFALIPVLTIAALTIIGYVSVTQMSTPAQYGYIMIAQLANVLFYFYTAKLFTGSNCARQTLAMSSFAVAANGAAYFAPLLTAVLTNSFRLS